MHACLPSRLKPHPRFATSSLRPICRSPAFPRALPEPFDSLFGNAVIVSSAVAIVATIAAPLSHQSKQQQQQQQQQQHQGASGEEANFEWAVTAVVSCIPLVNSIAWVMPAISSPSSRANLYLVYCALYSAPLLRSGFDFDAFSLLMLALCIVHVQAERIANTEVDLLLRLPVVPGLVEQLTSLGSGGLKLPSGEARSWEDATREENEAQDAASLELKEFDRMLLEREKKRIARGTKELP